MSSYLFFFGYEAVPGTPGKTTPPEGCVLHISQATLAQGAKEGEVYRVFVEVADDDEDDDEENQQETGEKKTKRYCICTLVGQKQETQHLDLNFAGESVTFEVEGGSTPVHLTGYYNVMEMEDDFDDQEAFMEGLENYNSDEDEDFEPAGDINTSADSLISEDNDEEEEVEAPKKGKKEQPKQEKAKQGTKRKAPESPVAEEKAPQQPPKKQKTEKQAAPKKEQPAAQQQQKAAPKKEQPAAGSPNQQGKKNKKNKKQKK